MALVKWAAVAVTLLMGLANLGQVLQTSGDVVKAVALVLSAGAVVAVVGIVVNASWGAVAIVAVGAVNLGAAVLAGAAGVDGWPIGLVLSAVGIVLGAAYARGSRSAAAA